MLKVHVMHINKHGELIGKEYFFMHVEIFSQFVDYNNNSGKQGPSSIATVARTNASPNARGPPATSKGFYLRICLRVFPF